MELITGQQPLPEHLAGGVAALGNFDGFHPGHQAVVRRAGELAAARGGPLLVITCVALAIRLLADPTNPIRTWLGF